MCNDVPLGTCGLFLAQNQTDSGIEFNMINGIPINLNTGFNNITFTDNTIIPQRSFLSFTKAGSFGGPRIDSSGTSNYSDYILNVVNQTASTYSLVPLNSALNYRFFVRAKVTELLLSKKTEIN